MITTLDSGSRGPGWSPGQGHFCFFLLYLTWPPSTQEYKWVLPNCQGNLTKCWGVTCDGTEYHPIRRSGGTFKSLHAMEFGISTRLIRLLILFMIQGTFLSK